MKKKQRNFKLSVKAAEALDNLNRETGINYTALVEDAIIMKWRNHQALLNVFPGNTENIKPKKEKK